MVSPPNVPERSGSKLSERGDMYGGSLPDRNLHASPKDSMYDKSKTAPSRLTKENIIRYKEEGLMIDVKPRPTLEHCGDSPDSGHNTCSSPVDSITNPSVDLEMSECSDLEGIDRVERLRVKTTINTSRIPSMCVITPPLSDDETSLKTLRALEAEDYGEYVTLAHVMPEPVAEPPESCKGFVHLNELPVGSPERKKLTGARVTLNAEGKVIYTSDSLKRRKKIHTTNTFEPGPCVSANVQLPVANKNNIVSQVIPRSPLNVRPVTKQTFSAQHVVAPKKLLSEQNPPSSSVLGNQLKPLVPIPLACSPGQRRSKIAFPPAPTTAMEMANAAVNRLQQQSPRVIVLPDHGRSPTTVGKPVSSLISPTRRSLSPKEVVKGAYVRMQDPTECLETSLDEIKSVVKRSDSYRQANAISPRMVAKSPNMLMTLHKARSENVQGTSYDGTSPSRNDSCRRSVDGKQNVSASTPVKNDRSAGRIDMSSNNISPIHDYRASPTGGGGGGHSRPSPAADRHGPLRPGPVGPHRSPVSSSSPLQPPNRGPAAAPCVRPASGRSAMDLYAAIHESKKRLLGQQSAVTATAVGAPVPRTVAVTTAAQRPPPERQSDRHHRPRDDRSARYDFKRLLLQTNMAGGRRAQQSAVVRLQQPAPPPARTVRGSPVGRRGPPPSWKSNVLSSTIQEDCREDENCYANDGVPRSATLVNRTLKDLTASSCSALETAL